MKLKKEDFEVTDAVNHNIITVLVKCFKAGGFAQIVPCESHTGAMGKEVIDRWMIIFSGELMKGIESCTRIDYKMFSDRKKAISFAERLMAMAAE